MIKLKNLKMKHYTKMNNGYYAVALDKKSYDVVKQNATMDVVVSNHITLAYKPNNETFEKLNKLCGKKVDVYIKEKRANKNIEAFWLNGMYLTETYKKLKRIDKGPAHITISHKKGFKSGDANTMFKNPTYKQDLQTEMEYLQGKIKWISFNNKKENNDNRPI